MGLDFGLTLSIPRAKGKSAYSIDLVYMRKCFDISVEILRTAERYNHENFLKFDEDGWKISSSNEEILPLLHDIGALLSKEYVTTVSDPISRGGSIWGTGCYARIIIESLHAITGLIMFLKKQIDFEELYHMIGQNFDTPTRTYVETYILNHEEEWNLADGMVLTCYYSY